MADLEVKDAGTGEAAATAAAPDNRSFWHKLFGTQPNDGDLQPKEAIAYSLCGFGQNLICTIIGSYLTIFMTDAIGYGALSVALLMLLARIYDALNDPIMGSIVDRTKTKWGKCRPYLKWMALPVAGITILCFLPWYPASPGGFAAMTIMYLIWGMVYTVCDVPYWGLTSCMTHDTYRRGNMLTIARLLCTAGAGLVTIIVPQITSGMTNDYQLQINAYQGVVSQLQVAYDKGELPEGVYLDFDENADKAYATIGSDLEGFINTYFGEGHAVWEAYYGNAAENAEAYAEGKAPDKLTGLVPVYEYYHEDDPDAVYEWSGADLQSALKGELNNKQSNLKWIYFIAAIVCVAVGTPLFFVGFKGTKERTDPIENPPSLKHNLQLLFKNKPLMLIVISGILGAARMVFTYTGGLYFCKYVLDNVELIGMHGEGLYTLVTIAIVPGGLIASVLVPFLTKKIGKKQSYIWTNIAGGVALLIAFIVGIAINGGGKGDYTDVATLVIAILAIVISGVPSGLTNIVSYAMIGDTVEYLELKTGERAEGICFAMQTFINKIGMAIGAFIGVMGYYIAGVTPNNPGALTASGKDIMWIMLMLVAAISFIASAIPMFFYKFTEKEQKAAVEEIKRRKAEKLAFAGADGTEVSEDAFDAATDGAEGVEVALSVSDEKDAYGAEETPPDDEAPVAAPIEDAAEEAGEDKPE